MRLGIFKCFLFLCLGSFCFGQTLVTATIVDSDGQKWFNGKWQVQLYSPNGIPMDQNGNPIAPTIYSGQMDANGSLSVSLIGNNLITPTGSMWVWTLCPFASVPCASNISTLISGTTQNVSAMLNSSIAAPRFYATSGTDVYGYLDIEVAGIPNPGAFYYNVTTQQTRVWTGTMWQNIEGVDTGITSLGVGNLSPLYNSVTNVFGTSAIITFTPQTAPARSVFVNNNTTAALPAWSTSPVVTGISATGLSAGGTVCATATTGALSLCPDGIPGTVSAVVGSAAGTGATVTIVGSRKAGMITLKSGTGLLATGPLVVTTFSPSFSTVAYCTFSPYTTTATAAGESSVSINSGLTTGFTMAINALQLALSATYQWTYLCSN